MHMFNDTNDKMLAAIDYTIAKYGDEAWFPAALRKATTEYIIRGDDRIEPLKIFELKGGGYGYTGYHYIINSIEEYNHSIVKIYSYKYLSLILFFIIFLIIILK